MRNLPARMGPDQVAALAQEHLARFDGGEQYPAAYDGGGYAYYDGSGDEHLYFEGSDNFVTKSNQRIFSASFTNAQVSNQVIYLFGGLHQPSLGTANDGTFKSVNNLDITCSAGNPLVPYKDLKEYVRYSPLEVGMIKINSSNTAQVIQKMTIETQDPWDNKTAARALNISTGQDQNVQQLTVLVMRTPGLILGPNTLISYTLLAGATVTLEFHFGAAKDSVRYLEKAVKAAAPAIARDKYGR